MNNPVFGFILHYFGLITWRPFRTEICNDVQCDIVVWISKEILCAFLSFGFANWLLMIQGRNSTKIKEGNLLIRELVHHYSCPALIAKLISKGLTRFWRRKVILKTQYNFCMGIHHLNGPKQNKML
jgi:hypothetical protein